MIKGVGYYALCTDLSQRRFDRVKRANHVRLYFCMRIQGSPLVTKVSCTCSSPYLTLVRALYPS